MFKAMGRINELDGARSDGKYCGIRQAERERVRWTCDLIEIEPARRCKAWPTADVQAASRIGRQRLGSAVRGSLAHLVRQSGKARPDLTDTAERALGARSLVLETVCSQHVDELAWD